MISDNTYSLLDELIWELADYDGADRDEDNSSKYAIYDKISSVLQTLDELPCKVGDIVYAVISCENDIDFIQDYSTGTSECPFEKECKYLNVDSDYEGEPCDNTLRVIKTNVKAIYDEGNGWKYIIKGLNSDYHTNDFGKTLFLTKYSADERLKELKK